MELVTLSASESDVNTGWRNRLHILVAIKTNAFSCWDKTPLLALWSPGELAWMLVAAVSDCESATIDNGIAKPISTIIRHDNPKSFILSPG
jgi:hypothetical protein